MRSLKGAEPIHEQLELELKSYQFTKPYYKQSELLALVSISNTTLKRYMEEWSNKGGDLGDMGHFYLKGCKEACFVPRLFISWLIANKINIATTYDYEVAERRKAIAAASALIQSKQKQQQKGLHII